LIELKIMDKVILPLYASLPSFLLHSMVVTNSDLLRRPSPLSKELKQVFQLDYDVLQLPSIRVHKPVLASRIELPLSDVVGCFDHYSASDLVVENMVERMMILDEAYSSRWKKEQGRKDWW
jgi:hypothetical protein